VTISLIQVEIPGRENRESKQSNKNKSVALLNFIKASQIYSETLYQINLNNEKK